jgi:ectoine hydroxylase-related dioxygenase (phytanoyl-CoA dioxygenase family)
MPKFLSEIQIAQYERDGFYHPLRALDAGEVTRCRRDVEKVERESLDDIGGAFRHKPHLLLKSLDAAVRNEKILDAVEDLIGPNIFVWASLFFTKDLGDPRFVGWHQDSTYWGLSGPEVINVWLALSHATVASGAMRILPGSHLQGQMSHRETYNKKSFLTRGQEVEAEIDEDDAVDILLEPGEFSIHHIRAIHGSGPNNGDDRRMGFTIRYIPTHLHQIHGRDRALLVRGKDEFGHFDHETSPDGDLSEQAIANYVSANESHNAILYKGAAEKGV